MAGGLPGRLRLHQRRIHHRQRSRATGGLRHPVQGPLLVGEQPGLQPVGGYAQRAVAGGLARRLRRRQRHHPPGAELPEQHADAGAACGLRNRGGGPPLWEQDPYFNPTSSDLNTQWREVSADAWASISASIYRVGISDAVYRFGYYPLAWGLKEADGSLWQANANYGSPYTQLVSSDAWAAVSQNVVIRASDLSLWRANSTDTNATGVNEISDGTFESIAASGGLTPAVLTDHSLWLTTCTARMRRTYRGIGRSCRRAARWPEHLTFMYTAVRSDGLTKTKGDA